MSQSSYIAAFIVIAFIVFITMRNELREYMDVLGIDGASTSSSAPVGSGIKSDVPVMRDGKEVF